LWYLNDECAVFSLFYDNTKLKMVKQILEINKEEINADEQEKES
jgi:hypothetical protein